MISVLKVIRTFFYGLFVVVYTVTLGIIAFILYPLLFWSGYLDFMFRFWTGGMLFVGGIKVEVLGLENLKKGEYYVFAANHQSLFDIPVCVSSIPWKMRMLAKKELFRIPVFGWAMYLMRHIKIDRSNREKAVKSVEAVVDRLINEDICPVVYPEGTRSPDGKIHKFKKGAFVLAIKSKRKLVPLTLIGTRNILPKKTFQFNPGRVKIIISSPIDTSEMDYKERNVLAEVTYNIISDNFNKFSPG